MLDRGRKVAVAVSVDGTTANALFGWIRAGDPCLGTLSRPYYPMTLVFIAFEMEMMFMYP